jgi:hypothetical protein
VVADAGQEEALVTLRRRQAVSRERGERLRSTQAAAEDELRAAGAAATEDAAVRELEERAAAELERAMAPVAKAKARQMVAVAEALGQWQAVAAA